MLFGKTVLIGLCIGATDEGVEVTVEGLFLRAGRLAIGLRNELVGGGEG